MNPLIEKFKKEKRWVNYRLVEKDDGFTKVPYQTNGFKASSTDPVTWSTYEDVSTISDKVGIVFKDDQLLLGIDIDHCIVDGRIEHELKEQIADLILEAETYTEISVSGTGLHLFLSLTDPIILSGHKKKPFELYSKSRYFTVSGNCYGEPKDVRTVSSEEALGILAIIDYPWKEIKESKIKYSESNAKTLDDGTVVEKIFNSKNGYKIKSLYNGDISNYKEDDSSADLALCSHLAFWTRKNAEQIERIWLASPLGKREKTQGRQDYRTRTIDTAIAGCDEAYQGENISQIDSLEMMLSEISSDTAKTKIINAINPILQKLINIDKISAENFILYSIKEYFGITKEEAKKYITRLNALRVESIQKIKEAKKEPKLPLILDRDIDSQEAYDAISEIGIVSMDTFKIITAVVISSQLRLNPPLWLLFIGVPSSFKTELVGLYDAMDDVYTLDTLSENAFSSGYVPPDGSDPKDLLPYLDNKAFIIKDMNTLFSMNEELVKKILGDLTSIFDGKFQKFTATRGMVEYRSLFSMIGCITPSILIKHYNYATQLGPRFFFLIVPELTQEEMDKSLERFWNEKDRKNKIIKTRQIVSSYCTQLVRKIKQHKNNPETKEIRTKINNIAHFIRKARGIAISSKTSFDNDKGEKIEYHEIIDHQVEHPWRILGQLKALLRILSFINGNDCVGEDELRIIRPIILSTMPVNRAEVLSVLTQRSGLSCKELSNEIGKSTKTIQRTMKELEAVGITDCYRDTRYNHSGKTPWLYFIVPEFASVLDAPIPTSESMSESKRNTGTVDSDKDSDNF